MRQAEFLGCSLPALLTPSALLAGGYGFVWVEAESLANIGGWVVDQQFMDLMGSPYLLAHGLGAPVPDAEQNVAFPEPGGYRVWAHTRDWVAPWNKPGATGRFQLLFDGRPLSTTFGNGRAE